MDITEIIAQYAPSIAGIATYVVVGIKILGKFMDLKKDVKEKMNSNEAIEAQNALLLEENKLLKKALQKFKYVGVQNDSKDE